MKSQRNYSIIKPGSGAQMAFALAGLLAFSVLAVLQHAGFTQQWDEAVLLALRTADPAAPIASTWLLPLLRFLTWFGDVVGLSIVGIASCCVLLYLRQRRDAVQLALSAFIGTVLMLSLKDVFARARPDMVPALAEVGTMSFPSGHALMSIAIYVPVAFLLRKRYPRLSRSISGALLAFLLLVGFSRMYLGVHYPSDVLAGWAAGVFTVAISYSITAIPRSTKVKSGSDSV